VEKKCSWDQHEKLLHRCIHVEHHLVVQWTDRKTRLVGPLGTCS